MRPSSYYVFSEPAAICQNMFLATEALGLGGWKHCGFLSLEILERMGFRIVAENEGAAFGNPIGLDDVFEASCPPYHPTMDAAVDAVHLMWVMQAHHIDTDYYDRFFGPGAYGPAHAAHMATWHR